MDKFVHSNRNVRLLTIGLQNNGPAVNLACLAALPEFELIGQAVDCDDGLRQALMIHPDVIVLLWNQGALKLLRALVHMRNEDFSPLVVAVTPEAFLHDPAPHDGVVTVGLNQRTGNGNLAERLHLLLAGLEQKR